MVPKHWALAICLWFVFCEWLLKKLHFIVFQLQFSVAGTCRLHPGQKGLHTNVGPGFRGPPPKKSWKSFTKNEPQHEPINFFQKWETFRSNQVSASLFKGKLTSRKNIRAYVSAKSRTRAETPVGREPSVSDIGMSRRFVPKPRRQFRSYENFRSSGLFKHAWIMSLARRYDGKGVFSC